MRSKIKTFAVLTPFILVALVSCSGGSQAEREPTIASTPETSPSPLALCTEAVPMGATHCLLELGQGTDTYWDDTDGVAPGTAGCHVEYESDACEGVRTGREFGEFCLDADRLVESNPGLDECHTHKNDKGKPDVISCQQWCQDQGSTGGSCEGNVAVQAGDLSCESARCVCATAG